GPGRPAAIEHMTHTTGRPQGTRRPEHTYGGTLTMPFITCSLFGTPPEDGAPPWPTFQPLAPWYIQGHEDLWVDIEHVPAALHTFRRELGRMAHTIKPRQDGRGHLVVVSGLPGTGKSSLLHMCVHELVGWLDEAAQERARAAATGPEGGEEQQ